MENSATEKHEIFVETWNDVQSSHPSADDENSHHESRKRQHDDDELSITASQNLDGLIRKMIKPNSSHHSKDGHIEPEQEMWSDVFKDYDQEETFAPEIAPPMASAAKIMWTKQFSHDKAKKKLEETYFPSNCKFLHVKRVNTQIFSQMSPSCRSTDISLQAVQQSLAKSQVKFLQMADKLTEAAQTKSPVDFMEIFSMFKEGVSLAGYANQKLNQVRRDSIKWSLPDEIKALAKNVPEADDSLFGDDLEKRIQTIQAAAKAKEVFTASADKQKHTPCQKSYVSSKFSPKYPPKRYEQYKSSYGSTRTHQDMSKNGQSSSKTHLPPRRKYHNKRGKTY